MVDERRSAAAPLTAVLLTAVLVSGCGGGSSASSPAGSGSSDPQLSTTIRPTSTTGGVQVFDLTARAQNAFSAATLAATPGKVRIVLHVEQGSAPHNVTFADLGGAHTPDVDAGGTGSVTVSVPQAGVYLFSCTIHPGMRAALRVG